LKKQSKVVLIVIFILLINTITYANSAPTYWTDYPSAGIIAVDKNTPVKILNENLLFDFTKDYDDSYSPSANVTAEYEMENPSNESISVQMESEKLKATKRYMEKKDVSIEQELADALVKLYEKYVPVAVREYIDETTEDSKPQTKTKKPKVEEQPIR